MKFLITFFWLAVSTCANSQDLEYLQFDRLEAMIGEEIDTTDFYPIKMIDKAKYLKTAFPYNVSYRAKVDSFYYNNYQTQGPWLCTANNKISAAIFFVHCNSDISKFLITELGEPTYSQAPLMQKNSDFRLLYVWEREKINIMLSQNPCSQQSNCIEGAIISVQHKNSSFFIQEF